MHSIQRFQRFQKIAKNILFELNIYNLKENINIEKIKKLKLSITVYRFLVLLFKILDI